MDHQWIVSILAGAIGGLFDGAAGSSGMILSGVWRRNDELGRAFYDLGTIGNILLGAFVGFLSFALNVPDADWSMAPRVPVTAGALIAGAGASEVLKRIRNEQKLKQATRRIGSGARKAFKAIGEIDQKQGDRGGPEPGHE